MKCWRCHSNSVNTGSHLPRGSDVKTRKRRNVVGVDMIRNNRIGFFFRKKVTSQTIINANKHRKLQISSKKLTQFSSPVPKGHVRYCHHLASVVVSKIIHFNLLLWNHLANWNQTWYGYICAETGIPGENHWPAASHWQTSPWVGFELTTFSLCFLLIRSMYIIETRGPNVSKREWSVFNLLLWNLLIWMLIWLSSKLLGFFLDQKYTKETRGPKVSKMVWSVFNLLNLRNHWANWNKTW